MSRELPLREFWSTRGARWKEEAGWNIPVSFQEPVEEYRAASRGRIIQDISHRGKIRVTGRDRRKVLHNILTQDLAALRPHEGAEAALLTANGRITALMTVLVFEDHLLLDVDPGLTDKTIALLDRYVITEDTSFSNEDGRWIHLLYRGITEFPMRPVTDARWKINLPPGEGIAPGGFWILRPWSSRTELILPAESKTLEKILDGAVPAGWEAGELLRIEAGELSFGTDAKEDTILSETGMEDLWISSTKGCYPGQEVVARIETYKGLLRKFVGFSGSGKTPPVGLMTGVEGKKTGVLTSVGTLPEGGFVALACLEKPWFTEKQMGWKSGDAFYQADITPLGAKPV